MKSKYEVEFSKYPSTELVENFMGFDIYSYTSGVFELAYTFWFGEECNDYISGVKTLEEARESIMTFIEYS